MSVDKSGPIDDLWRRLGEYTCVDHSHIPGVVESCLGCFAGIAEWWNRDDDVEHACYLLMTSPLFSEDRKDSFLEYLVEFAGTRPPGCELWIVYAILLRHGRADRNVLVKLKSKGILRKLRQEIDENDERAASGFQCTAVQLTYEVCRIQRLDNIELDMIDHQFIGYLMDLVEQTRTRRDETFNYSVINLVLAFNEQFIQTMHSQSSAVTGAERSPPPSMPMPLSNDFSPTDPEPPRMEGNRVLTVLVERINCSKTFSENLVFMLNRAQDQTTQILLLKLLYLIFTTPGTMMYFYTNDLRVLIDVILRQLNDLPEEQHKLRHNYLRVLQHLLTNSQYGVSLNSYKASEMGRTLLNLDMHAKNDADERRRQINETTLRLINRILQECPFLERKRIS